MTDLRQAEPTCPSCKAGVLYECVACSSNNYPPWAVAQPEQEPVACPVCNQVHTILDADESQIIRNAKDGYPDGRTPRLLTLQERITALCKYASDWKSWCLEKENTTPQAHQRQWVSLTDEEMSDIVADIDVDFGDLLWKVVCLTKIIEAELKERNT